MTGVIHSSCVGTTSNDRKAIAKHVKKLFTTNILHNNDCSLLESFFGVQVDTTQQKSWIKTL